MACRYYDDILVEKLKKWIPDNGTLRILRPDETKKLFEMIANDKNDKPITLPIIALSRDPDVKLLSNIKTSRSFDGLKIDQEFEKSLQFNVIPILLMYQLDIYTKTEDEADEYMRTLLFKLINNPSIKIELPYNGTSITHTANIRVEDTVSDTSDISERIFSGQFHRWTIQLEIQDAFLFSIPYKTNWKLYIDENNYIGGLELSKTINSPGEIEALPVNFKK